MQTKWDSYLAPFPSIVSSVTKKKKVQLEEEMKPTLTQFILVFSSPSCRLTQNGKREKMRNGVSVVLFQLQTRNLSVGNACLFLASISLCMCTSS